MPTDPALFSAHQLIDHFKWIRLSPVEVLQAVEQRIDQFDPVLRSFIVRDESALSAAKSSEARWASGRPIGLLDGVPASVKDLIDLKGLPPRSGI